jgi:hypothetical protein
VRRDNTNNTNHNAQHIALVKVILSKVRFDYIPQLQPGDNIIPPLINIIKIQNIWDAIGTFRLPIISCLFDKSLFPNVGCAPSRKPYFKNGRVETVFAGGDACRRFKTPNYPYQSFI